MALPAWVEDALTQALAEAPDPLEAIADLRAWLAAHSPLAAQPVDHVRWVPIERVTPNSYNPNRVARIELGLLLLSIEHDGYTQPVVTVYDPERDLYEIVDGFHRYFVMKSVEAIAGRTGGLLPVVVLDKAPAERMASTVRHNRARGKHTIEGMGELVFKMLEAGMADSAICTALGMEAEELLRLKHVTGFSKLYADRPYRPAWTTPGQIAIGRAREALMAGEDVPDPPWGLRKDEFARRWKLDP